MATVIVKPAIAPRSVRVGLADIVKRTNVSPLRLVVTGVEGVGKSTFAAGAPSPVILGPEDGIPRSLGEVAHYPVPLGGWTWPDVIDAVRALGGDHDFKTLVIDTLDWIEPILWADVCARAGKSSIEEVGGGYGRGYAEAVTGWRSLIAELEAIRRSRGMNIILIAHTTIRSFKNPVGEDYDRFEMKLQKSAAGLWKEWPDAVLFACHDDVVSKDDRTKRARGMSTGARVIRTTHHAAYDAKNRFNLPEELPLSWADFASAVDGGASRAAELRESIGKMLDAEEAKAFAPMVRGMLERAGDDVGKLAQAESWLGAKINQKGA